MTNQRLKVLIKGAGEVASGIAHAVNKAGHLVYVTEIPAPLAVSRATCFSDAIFDGSMVIEGVTAVLTPLSASKIDAVWQEGKIPVLVDPDALVLNLLLPDVLVDARMLKKVGDTRISDAAQVIGIGTGFFAGKDVHVIIESNDRTGNLGKLIFQGESDTNTGEPIPVGGLTSQRVIWAPVGGTFKSDFNLGDAVSAGQVGGTINGN
jgi:xanthine dehydrogenase accessory factor